MASPDVGGLFVEVCAGGKGLGGNGNFRLYRSFPLPLSHSEIRKDLYRKNLGKAS